MFGAKAKRIAYLERVRDSSREQLCDYARRVETAEIKLSKAQRVIRILTAIPEKVTCGGCIYVSIVPGAGAYCGLKPKARAQPLGRRPCINARFTQTE